MQAIDGNAVTTTVERGGVVRSRAGVNVPAERLSLPAHRRPRPRSWRACAVDLGIDLRRAVVRADAGATSIELRSLLGPDGPAIVAKIETRSAVDGFEAIATVADGVMVARGDLGLELPFEAVPIVQKRLVAAARSARQSRDRRDPDARVDARPPARPTRAEASDVANAVLDGADAVMLSGETAIGALPGPRRPGGASDRGRRGGGHAVRTAGDADRGAGRARRLARDRGRRARRAGTASVCVLVAAGREPREAPSPRPPQRPAVPIVAVVPDARIARLLMAVRGVWPVVPADPAFAADPGVVPAETLLRDVAVREALPGPAARSSSRAPRTATVERIEALAIPPRRRLTMPRTSDRT